MVIAITAIIVILILVIIIQKISLKLTVKAWIYYAEKNGHKKPTAEELEQCVRFVREKHYGKKSNS